MHIYARLTQDHDDHRALCDALEEAQGTQERRRLLRALRLDVEAHADAEEQTLYAAMLAEPDAQDTARHSIVEHEELEELFDAAAETDPADDDAWHAAISDLTDRLRHHMEEEEEDVFPVARRVFDVRTAMEMAETFETRKHAEKRDAAITRQAG